VSVHPRVERAAFLPFDGAFTERHYAIAAVFQAIWCRTQLRLPDDSPDRAAPLRHDSSWHDSPGRSTTRTVDMATLSQSKLPFDAQRANLETAAFVDGWLSDYYRVHGTGEELRGSRYEKRLILLLFMFWSTVRLTADGRKRSESVIQLPASSIAEIGYWRALSLAEAESDIDELLAAKFIRTPYQATLDCIMVRGAIECYWLPSDDIAELARLGGWQG
jgi:hypothetical protein